ncbi:unnamed protein product [Leptidea sinapis]|uniref:Uncharacterized protein n=1 Tax=Leptidea sinapis TaxID=189913 RepID=A0A5E4PNS7_9NEOP|nr:unnamed protein product [Leptidea sinapis]
MKSCRLQARKADVCRIPSWASLGAVDSVARAGNLRVLPEQLVPGSPTSVAWHSELMHLPLAVRVESLTGDTGHQ